MVLILMYTIVTALGRSCLLFARKFVQQFCHNLTIIKIYILNASVLTLPTLKIVYDCLQRACTLYLTLQTYVYNCHHSWPFMLIVGAQQSVQLQFCRPLCLPLCAPQLSNEPVIYLKSSVNFNCHSTQQMAWPASFLVQK